jgi:hypothetical protein
MHLSGKNSEFGGENNFEIITGMCIRDRAPSIMTPCRFFFNFCLVKETEAEEKTDLKSAMVFSCQKACRRRQEYEQRLFPKNCYLHEININ